MEHKAYTRFTVEIAYRDGDVDKCMIEKNNAEMCMEEVFDTLRMLTLGMSFSPETVSEYFDPCESCELIVLDHAK